MTITEKFDKEVGCLNGEWLRSIDGVIMYPSPDEIKQFYQKEIQAMIDEMIGKKPSCCLCDTHPGECSCSGKNFKRREIIDIAKKYI